MGDCKKYRPSNGTEGMIFTDHYCGQCIHEKFMHTQNFNDKQCKILNNTLIYDFNDEQYPKEWTYDKDGYPTCTEFKKWDWGPNDNGGWNEPIEPEPVDPNQLCLPFEMNEITEQKKVLQQNF